MRNTIAALMALGVLSGCGGDDDEAADKAPTVAVSLAATAESGQIIPIGVTVTDDKDQNLAFNLACTGATLEGTLLSLPVVTAQTAVECTASATDSAGNTTTVKQTITVTPATAHLNAYMGTSEAIPAGGVGILFAENVALDQPEYQGTLNGRTIRLYRANGNELVYALPLDMPAGTGTLAVRVGNRNFTTQVAVGAAIAVEDYRDRVAGFLRSARQGVVTALATPGLSAMEREQLEGSLPQLDTALATMPNASDAEISQFASRLAALGLIGSGVFRALDYNPIQTGPDCSRNRDLFAKNLAGMVLGALLIAEGANTAIAGALVPGAGWGVGIGAGLAIGAGVVLFQKFGPEVNPSRKAFWTSCWTETTINLVPFNTDDFQGIRTQAITLPGKQAFRKKQARSFKLQRSFTPQDSLRAYAAQYASAIGKVLAAARFLPSGVSQALSEFKLTGAEAVPAGRLSLSGISSGKVTGSASANEDVVTLTFDTSAKAEDLTDGKLPFSFTLQRSGEESVIVNAEMSLALPEAFDAAVEVIQGSVVNSSVRTTGAETLAVTKAPANGTVTLSDSGNFTYRPSGMWFGRDQFKFVARNADGESEEATVIVDVVRKFDGIWQVSVESRTTSESEPGICPPESSNFAAGVSKISDTQYSTTFAGFELIMNMGSKDDPSGPSGSRSYTDQGEDEFETGTVSISIPDSQTLRGSGSWTWRGENKTRCSGTTTITGRR